MNELLQVQVIAPTLAEPTTNLDEVQDNIDGLLAAYTGRVYTADEIKGAKADRAQVNKWDKQLADAATAIKKHYLERVDPVLDRIAAMRRQVKEVSAAIDRQVKEVEEGEREDKRRALELIYRDAAGEDLTPLIPFARLMEDRWLNKSVSLAAAGRELRKAVATRREELRMIRANCGEDAEACVTEYLRGLSLNDALNECQRRKDARAALAQAEAAREARQRLERAAPVVVPPTEEERQIQAEAAAAAQAGAFVTKEGRLDTELLQTFAQPSPPQRRRYRFWVDFTPEDVAWFKAAAAERGFSFGSVK